MGGFERSRVAAGRAMRRWLRLLPVAVLAAVVVCASPPQAPVEASPATGGYELWVWGRNDVGQLGLGTSGSDVVFPQRLGSDADIGWSSVTVAQERLLGIRADGTLWQWGRVDTQVVTTPQRISAATDWVKIGGSS